MLEFIKWIKETPRHEHYSDRIVTLPWTILGKGPTFSQHTKYKDLYHDTILMGLNHVCRERHMFITHIIDANVIDEVPDLEKQTAHLVMPYHPHFNFQPSGKTLEDLVREKPVLEQLDKEGRLLWYNLCTGKQHGSSPVVQVRYFSAEAAIRLLAIGGVKRIRTLGIDGGNKYASEFSDITPFRGGHTTFDIQRQSIKETVDQFGLDFKPLGPNDSQAYST